MQDRFNELFHYNDDGTLTRKVTRAGNALAGSVVGSYHPSATNPNQHYLTVRVDNRLWLVHRVIWVMFHGDIPEGYEIDHINLIGSDNRLENLRLVTGSENIRAQTVRRRKDNTSSIVGVSFDTQRNKWRAYINIDGKQIMRRFSTLEEATEHRKLLEKEFGFDTLHNTIG